MDIIQLFQDFSISFATEGHKHCRPGWVNTECPFCTGNPGLHLGFKLSENRFVCWRCGGHSIEYTLSRLLHIDKERVNDLIDEYGGISVFHKDADVKIGKLSFRLPSNVGDLGPKHIRYLESRNFDPIKLEQEWGLMGTGPVSSLAVKNKLIRYNHRIIIPFHWDNKIVSFDSRDITGKTDIRYIAYPLEREIIPHKSILYGRQEKWKDSIIIVEGPTDTWRFGSKNAGATSGIEYTLEQVRYIAKRFKRVAVCFDDDPQAIVKANDLVGELKFRGVDAFRVDIVGDPGNMNQKEADYLVKQLIK